MKNKTMLFAMVLLLFSISVQAQVEKAEMTFAKGVYQFGTVKEDAEDVNIEFEFTNSGNSLLTISDVKSEKGIDITSWPKASVAPGEKGVINVVFHPKGNANRIYKKVTVYSNAKKPVETLSVVGNVTPIPGSVADKYRKSLGNEGLRLKNTYVVLGNITNKDKKESTIEMINDSDKEMTLSFRNIPDHITVTASSEVLKAHQKGTITISYDAGLNKKADGTQKWGAQNDRFYIVVNGLVNESGRNSVAVKASISEDFDNMSAKELANAPKIEFTELVFNFGTIKQGDVVKHDFTFKNLGENDLEIRHVKAT